MKSKCPGQFFRRSYFNPFCFSQSRENKLCYSHGQFWPFENSLGSTFPKRGDYEFIKTKTQDIFYDSNTATKELVDEVYDTVNDRNKAIRIVATAKSAVRHNLSDKLHLIKAPTLLVWGDEDSVTPVFVGEKFNELIENSKLVIIEKSGHAPMMERKEAFNKVLNEFLLSVT